MEVTNACRCCLLRPSERHLNTPYCAATGTDEVYSDMLASCFGIKLALDDDECGICEECVGLLQAANDFKLRVLHSQAELRKQMNIVDKKPVVLGMLEENDTMIFLPRSYESLKTEDSYEDMNGTSDAGKVDMSVGTDDELITQKHHRGAFTRKLVYNIWRKHHKKDADERDNLVFEEFTQCLGIKGEDTLSLVRDQIKYVCSEIRDRFNNDGSSFVKKNQRWLNSSVVISKVDNRADFAVCKRCDAYRRLRRVTRVRGDKPRVRGEGEGEGRMPRLHAVCSLAPAPRRPPRRAASV